MKKTTVFGKKDQSALHFLAFVLALPLLLAGCEILDILGLRSDDDSDEGGEPAWTGPQIEEEDEDGEPAWAGPQIAAKDEAGIKAKFGIEAEGTAGVKAAFETLHYFIQSGGLEKYPDVIRLGDWIDLEDGLAVAAYGEGGGDFSHDADAAMQEITLDGVPWGTLCRLIVVGINSFQSGKGSDGKYEITANDGTPHVVFQFQNLPVKRRMNEYSKSAGGYAAREIRRYFVPVENDSESGKFLTGLIAAGVPENVLWGPERVLSAGMDNTGVDTLSDKLWLPTERELFGVWSYSANGETKANQARLEYYTSDTTRIKVATSPDGYPNVPTLRGQWYWGGSSYFGNLTSFCGAGYTGNIGGHMSSEAGGVAPAFCVN
jgi:hypothetical protein